MEFTPIKQTLIGFTVFLTILFLGSCGVAEDTAPPGPSPDYMSFTLTNSSGSTVTTTTQLSRGSTYGLVIIPTNDAPILTADYTVTYTPADAIIIDVIRTNSVDFTVDNTAATSITVTVTHKSNSAVSESVTLNLASQATAGTSFQADVENATTVPNLILANALTREVLSPLGSIRGGATLEKRYVTESGGATTQDGSSWVNAWAATNLRNAITNITNATASRVYLVMVAGGTYKPTYTTSRTISFSMTNHVAIMGGFQTGGGWARTGTTVFSGDIGVVGTTTDNSYQVFSHVNTPLENAHLYGVTITNGNANGAIGTIYINGGGMINNLSSPVLTRVVFSGNNATSGGGMYNVLSSPVLTRVVFSGNNADNGGGMFNLSSSPVLTRVVFSRNSATFDGGGIHNWTSSPVIIGAVFRNNSAANGGAMWNDNGSTTTTVPGPLIVNTIFSGNTLSGLGSGSDIAVDKGGIYSGAEVIRIAGSVLGIGLAQPTNAIIGYNGTDPINIEYHSLANGAVRFGADATTGGLTYPTITTGSAVNLGLFVRRSGTTYYFSETGSETSWHTSFTSTGAGGLDGTAVDLPTTGTIEDLTATDIAGNARNARPDAGVFEVR